MTMKIRPSPFAHRKSFDAYYVKSSMKGSYLAECPRDEGGHCLPQNEADRTGRGKDKKEGARAEKLTEAAVVDASRNNWAKGKFTNDEITVGLDKLSRLPNAGEGYTHFDTSKEQIRCLSLGMKGVGKLIGHLPDANDKKWSLESLDPSKVSYGQIAVIRKAVENKLRAGGFEHHDEFGGDNPPTIVKEGDEYYLQNGFHRAAAQILATGKITAAVIEVANKSKTGKRSWKKPGTIGPSHFRKSLDAYYRKG